VCLIWKSDTNQIMRLHCEFGSCHCPQYLGRGLCRRCGHGKCWHKNSSQFDSSREYARTPSYQRIPVVPAIFLPMLPDVPPIESDEDNYCESLSVLPV